jgi:hypothetical protein
MMALISQCSVSEVFGISMAKAATASMAAWVIREGENTGEGRALGVIPPGISIVYMPKWTDIISHIAVNSCSRRVGEGESASGLGV